MQLPAKFIGHWEGMINHDVMRKNPYKATVVIKSDGIATTYGNLQGVLSEEYTSNACLVFKELANSFKGTLMMYLDADSNLKCVWFEGTKFRCEAMLSRVEPATP
jgi:hypothetical protein